MYPTNLFPSQQPTAPFGAPSSMQFYPGGPAPVFSQFAAPVPTYPSAMPQTAAAAATVPAPVGPFPMLGVQQPQPQWQPQTVSGFPTAWKPIQQQAPLMFPSGGAFVGGMPTAATAGVVPPQFLVPTLLSSDATNLNPNPTEAPPITQVPPAGVTTTATTTTSTDGVSTVAITTTAAVTTGTSSPTLEDALGRTGEVGGVHFVSNARGATVVVNGKNIGITPCIWASGEPGKSYNVEYHLDGFDPLTFTIEYPEGTAVAQYRQDFKVDSSQEEQDEMYAKMASCFASIEVLTEAVRRLMDSMGESQPQQEAVLKSLRQQSLDEEQFFTRVLQLYDTLLNLPDRKVPKRASGVSVACETEVKPKVSVSVTADDSGPAVQFHSTGCDAFSPPSLSPAYHQPTMASTAIGTSPTLHFMDFPPQAAIANAVQWSPGGSPSAQQAQWSPVPAHAVPMQTQALQVGVPGRPSVLEVEMMMLPNQPSALPASYSRVVPAATQMFVSSTDQQLVMRSASPALSVGAGQSTIGRPSGISTVTLPYHKVSMGGVSDIAQFQSLQQQWATESLRSNSPVPSASSYIRTSDGQIISGSGIPVYRPSMASTITMPSGPISIPPLPISSLPPPFGADGVRGPSPPTIIPNPNPSEAPPITGAAGAVNTTQLMVPPIDLSAISMHTSYQPTTTTLIMDEMRSSSPLPSPALPVQIQPIVTEITRPSEEHRHIFTGSGTVLPPKVEVVNYHQAELEAEHGAVHSSPPISTSPLPAVSPPEPAKPILPAGLITGTAATVPAPVAPLPISALPPAPATVIGGGFGLSMADHASPAISGAGLLPTQPIALPVTLPPQPPMMMVPQPAPAPAGPFMPPFQPAVSIPPLHMPPQPPLIMAKPMMSPNPILPQAPQGLPQPPQQPQQPARRQTRSASPPSGRLRRGSSAKPTPRGSAAAVAAAAAAAAQEAKIEAARAKLAPKKASARKRKDKYAQGWIQV